MALARSLAVQPSVLLLDEPFGALDARVRKELRAWLRRLHDEVHVTTVFVTHDQEEAMEVADRIVVMNHGRVEQVGGPRDLYEHPANAFVMGFVGPVTRLGELFVRPHDVEVRRQPNGTTSEAMVERLVHLGFEVRAELVLHDGQHVWAQLSREDAEERSWPRPDRVRPSQPHPPVRRGPGLRGLVGAGGWLSIPCLARTGHPAPGALGVPRTPPAQVAAVARHWYFSAVALLGGVCLAGFTLYVWRHRRAGRGEPGRDAGRGRGGPGLRPRAGLDPPGPAVLGRRQMARHRPAPRPSTPS